MLNTLMREGLVALREGRPAETLDRFGGLHAPAASTASRRTTTRPRA